MQQSENQPAAIDVALWPYPKNEGDRNRWIRSLPPDELERAARYRFDRDRTSFIAGRYLLRRMLSAHAGIRPSEVALVADEYGRLTLDRRDAPRFSLANADGLVAVAVASGCEHIGIDCERIDTEIEAAALESYCSPGERGWLGELPASERARAAVELWTFKESHLKALGIGLREDPRNVAFAWENGLPVAAHNGERDGRWFHRLIESGSQHVAALAVCSRSGLPAIDVRLFQDDSTESE
ncbi:4'-phosphopantetheinyl transferase superfamily protein [Rhizobium lentis]|uniref:4'-phosphopantetheinyl transferase superfamily protein n=1 Tax=Rhizobium lentis TaxID=1138194 RepID=A0A9Q3MFD6_9HYPH|nr:4'-phosphopantetheinyl transferase superfamily protein [Rhizobium lentis]MBX4958126.1 4'-phosphopantetheinyl transferase superfamily protein [Rhizobium lentis]MBX4976297.1 4'-phosphopantetheinyl transferase superfamily protein [Rhizobium lentis]MBX4988130.1 4'-phosphopantetheinyl transferase superfamily protein [Rhizobium lentis]MBX5001956.1 4'-phosphopantetheinyl transferase superfamily protein [Rhizobium lentis]MBX5006579.1 4'-phosphopantetheinyl transferase superfamily protein [Rhizobium